MVVPLLHEHQWYRRGNVQIGVYLNLRGFPQFSTRKTDRENVFLSNNMVPSPPRFSTISHKGMGSGSCPQVESVTIFTLRCFAVELKSVELFVSQRCSL